MRLNDTIDKIVLCNPRVAAVSVAIKSVWDHCPWIDKAVHDVDVVMRASDIVFRSAGIFTFFHNDMMAQRYPDMQWAVEYPNEGEMNAFIQDNPAGIGCAYHTSSYTDKFESTYILRLFYLAP
jgi:hypothetical protein